MIHSSQKLMSAAPHFFAALSDFQTEEILRRHHDRPLGLYKPKLILPEYRIEKRVDDGLEYLFVTVNYSTPGTFTNHFTVPSYGTALSVDVKGAGAGGGAGGSIINETYNTPSGPGTAGGTSSFAASVFGYGGSPGGGGHGPNGTLMGAGYVGANGAHGTAAGGDTNTTGGGSPGGGGGASFNIRLYSYGINYHGGTGGNGGRAQKSYTLGALTPGALITIVVGSAGGGGSPYIADGSNYGNYGSAGTAGMVTITYDLPKGAAFPSSSFAHMIIR